MGSCRITLGAQPGALRQPRGVGWWGGREVQEGGDIRLMYVVDGRHQHNIEKQLSSNFK